MEPKALKTRKVLLRPSLRPLPPFSSRAGSTIGSAGCPLVDRVSVNQKLNLQVVVQLPLVVLQLPLVALKLLQVSPQLLNVVRSKLVLVLRHSKTVAFTLSRPEACVIQVGPLKEIAT